MEPVYALSTSLFVCEKEKLNISFEHCKVIIFLSNFEAKNACLIKSCESAKSLNKEIVFLSIHHRRRVRSDDSDGVTSRRMTSQLTIRQFANSAKRKNKTGLEPF